MLSTGRTARLQADASQLAFHVPGTSSGCSSWRRCRSSAGRSTWPRWWRACSSWCWRGPRDSVPTWCQSRSWPSRCARGSSPTAAYARCGWCSGWPRCRPPGILVVPAGRRGPRAPAARQPGGGGHVDPAGDQEPAGREEGRSSSDTARTRPATYGLKEFGGVRLKTCPRRFCAAGLSAAAAVTFAVLAAEQEAGAGHLPRRFAAGPVLVRSALAGVHVGRLSRLPGIAQLGYRRRPVPRPGSTST